MRKSTRYTPRSKEKIYEEKVIQKYGLKLRSLASEGLDTAVKQLLEEAKYKNLDIIDLTDQFGYSALHESAMWAHVDIIEILLENNANVALKNAAGETALHWAVMNGHEQVVSTLLHHGESDPNERQNKGKTALHLAAEKNDVNITKMLLRAGSDCNIKDQNKKTPSDVASPNSECFLLLSRDPKKRIQLLYMEKLQECEELKITKEKLINKVKSQRAEIQSLKKEVMKQQDLIVTFSPSAQRGLRDPTLIKNEVRQRKPKYFLSRVWGEEQQRNGNSNQKHDRINKDSKIMKLEVLDEYTTTKNRYFVHNAGAPIANANAPTATSTAAPNTPPLPSPDISTVTSPSTSLTPSTSIHNRTKEIEAHLPKTTVIRSGSDKTNTGSHYQDIYRRSASSPLIKSLIRAEKEKMQENGWSNYYHKKKKCSPDVVRTFH